MDRSQTAAPTHRQYVLDGHAFIAPTLSPGLYLVATPIGNLGDVTLRALAVLAAADLIACEDTRHSRKLLDRYDIKTPVTPYHEHNATAARPKLIARLKQRASIALISDAGTPLISDPGYKLVREAHAAGCTSTALPGASALLAALTLSGITPDRFLFEGFLPARQAARRARIAELTSIPATLVLFESPERLPAALADLAAAFGARDAAVCRELTKLHEEVRRGDLETLAGEYAAQGPVRGEIVVVIAPPQPRREFSVADLEPLLRAALARVSLKEAVAEMGTVTGLPRRVIYQHALALRREIDHGR
jgi:16S rRNA (cytidine1402-2'-O)-methyltransferase